MKKKLLVLLMVIFSAFCCLFGLGACDALLEDDVTLTFTVDGKEYVVTTAGGKTSLTMPEDPTKAGYTFDGWFTDENLWNNPFTLELFRSGAISADTDIFAKFKPINYNIHFEDIEGAINENSSFYTIEDHIVLKNPQSDNRNFIGWYCNGQPITEIPLGSMEDITITAMWTANLTGTIFKSGTDYDLSNSLPLDGVMITLSGNGIEPIEIESTAVGAYSFENIPTGTYTLAFSKEGCILVEITVTVSVHTSEDIFMDIEQDSTLGGTVLRADNDTNPSNNEKIVGANVTLSKYSGTNELILHTTTDENGKYSFVDLTAGIYTIAISKEGYMPVEQFVMVEEGVDIVQNMALEVFEEVEEEEILFGNASGMVYDAAIQGDYGVEGLTLEVRGGVNNITQGDVYETLLTGANGAYELNNYLAGSYTVKIIDNRVLENEDDRYDSAYFNIKILPGETIANQNGSVFSEVESFSGLKVILEWGEYPSDLDSHLTGPTEGGGRFHVYYSNKTYGQITNLDRDDTSSYGPETTTIDLSVEGVYRFSIHDYTNRSSYNATGIKNSGVTVKVYDGNRLLQTFYAPEEAGTLWTVFEYDTTTGRITSINQMSNQSDPSYIS